MVVVFVLLKMRGQVLNIGGQQRNLHLGGAGITGDTLLVLYDLILLFGG